MNRATSSSRAVHDPVARARRAGCRTSRQQRRIDMFETSVVRVQARAADRRIGLLTISIAVHAAIIMAIVAAGIASVQMPNQAPMQMTIPVFDHLPPALGTPDAKPAAKPQTPQKPQTQRIPVPQTVTAPQIIPATVPQTAATDSGSDTQTTGSGDSTNPGVPWGSKEGVGTDGPPAATPPLVEQSGPLVAGVGDVKAPIVIKRVSPPYPPIAVRARMQGFVIVECIIDR